MKSTIKTWRLLTIIVGAVVMAFALIGCRTKKEVITKIVEVHDTLYYERTYVDTLIHIEADTAQARLLVECDADNNALISIVDQLTGDKTSLQSLISYYEDLDSGRRKAIIDITAVVQEQDQEIKILREALAAASNSNSQEHKDSDSEPAVSSWWSLLGVFALGVCFAFVAFITIRKA